MGTITTHAVSKAGVIPWYPVTVAVASAACANAGKRLCKSDEWMFGCDGGLFFTYSYGDEYDPTVCNTIDTFCYCGPGSVCEAANPCPYPYCWGTCGAWVHVVPTGSLPDCYSTKGLHDITGNVWEAVSSDDGLEHFRGGAFNCIDSKALSRCDHDATWGPTARGFRCCAAPTYAP
jgi:formylglycine-generating enzyme required for sulfatase activity